MIRLSAMLCMIGLVLGTGCDEGDSSSPEPEPVADIYVETGSSDIFERVEQPEVIPASPIMARISSVQYANLLKDLFGDEIVSPATLEPSTEVGGLFAIGSSIASLSPRGVELYEEAARSVASQVVSNLERLQGLHECVGTGNEGCYREVASAVGRRLWRRPLVESELDMLVGIADMALEAIGEENSGYEYLLITLLQSPDFIYRLESGEKAGEGEGRRYSAYEMASRLSFFLWNSIPDLQLLDAAESGKLLNDAGLESEIDRMMESPKVRRAVRNFFREWLELHALDHISKDPNIFKHSSADIGKMAREETLLLAEHLIFEERADLRTFFTTNTTFVNRRLAAIYNVPAVKDEGFGKIELPHDGPRAGFFGHVSFLGLHAHPVSTSATLRGLFTREKLLCMTIPPPPAGLNTAIPESSAEAPTLKERLKVHMEDPSCAGCHALTDVVGFGFEQFDGLGLYRVEENGAQIDPSGRLDGVDFQDARALSGLIAGHPGLPECLSMTLYSYASNHEVEDGERSEIRNIAAVFSEGGDFLDLMKSIALSESFRRVGEVEP